MHGTDPPLGSPAATVCTLTVQQICRCLCLCDLQFTDPKLGSELKFDVMDFKGPTREHEDNITSSMLDSAKIFSEIWETGPHTLLAFAA